MPTPYIDYVAGKDCPASWQLLTGVEVSAGVPDYTYDNELVLPVLDHGLREMADKIDVSNALSGGIQGLLKGFYRGEFTMKFFVSNEHPRFSDQQWYNPAAFGSAGTMFMFAGQRGIMNHYVAEDSWIQIPVMIHEIGDVVNLVGASEVDVSASVDSNAGEWQYYFQNTLVNV